MAKQRLIKPLSDEKRGKLDQLYKRIWPNLIKRCRKLTRNAADADDLAQDTIIRIVGTGHDFDKINGSYSYKTASSIYSNRRRNCRLEVDSIIKTSVGEEDRKIDPIGVASFKKYQEQGAEERAKETMLSVVLVIKYVFSNYITEEEAELVRLRFIDKLDYGTIAERVGKPRGQVRCETDLAWKKFKYQFLKRMRK